MQCILGRWRSVASCALSGIRTEVEHEPDTASAFYEWRVIRPESPDTSGLLQELDASMRCKLWVIAKMVRLGES